MAFPSDLARTKNWSTEVLTDADLEGQFDLIINWVMAALNSSTGHNHDGSSNQGPEINITNLTVSSQAQGDIIYASSASAWARLGAGTSGYFLKTQGAAANPIWAVVNQDQSLAGSTVQRVNTQTGAVATGTTLIPYDDTIPQNTEGTEVMTLAITPGSATNKLKIDVVVHMDPATNVDQCVAALFQDSTAGALACGWTNGINASMPLQIKFTHYMAAGTTSSTTFKVRIGADNAGTFTFNGEASARKYGGVLASSITITEIKV